MISRYFTSELYGAPRERVNCIGCTRWRERRAQRHAETRVAYGPAELEANVTVFHAVLLSATLLCSLVAGFLFAFAAVVMPGIRRLDDGGFIRAFQVIDGVIQNNQPLFSVVWAGSVLALIAAAVWGVWELTGVDRTLVIAAALVYLLCVQLPTIAINIPLNNTLQKLNPSTMDEPARKRAREAFEPRWNRWNAIRTALAILVSVLLLLLLVRV